MLSKYLPIGSIVVLNNGTKKLMVTGFCTAPADNPDLIYDYAACLYPEGVVSTDRVLLFNHSDINEIFFVGFVDQEQQKFIERLKDLMTEVSQGGYTDYDQVSFKEPELTALPKNPSEDDDLIEFFIK